MNELMEVTKTLLISKHFKRLIWILSMKSCRKKKKTALKLVVRETELLSVPNSKYLCELGQETQPHQSSLLSYEIWEICAYDYKRI